MIAALPACALALVAAAAAPDAGTVTVPTGRTTTLVVVPAPVVLVPAGPFTMGADAAAVKLAQALCTDELRAGGSLILEATSRCGGRYDNESPQVEVSLPAYAIDRTEVTVAAYAACVRAGACAAAPETAPAGAGDLPVEQVTWTEAAAYCRFRGGRLPTEAEWEKAAAGPARKPHAWPWGSAWRDGRANQGRAERLGSRAGKVTEPPPGTARAARDELADDADGFIGRAPVGKFPAGASPFGVLDLAGNVWEWTSDHFAREPPQVQNRFDPRGPPFAPERTVRGGGYRSPPSDLRITRRVGVPPSERRPALGFRCAYDGPPGR